MCRVAHVWFEVPPVLSHTDPRDEKNVLRTGGEKVDFKKTKFREYSENKVEIVERAGRIVVEPSQRLVSSSSRSQSWLTGITPADLHSHVKA